MITIENHNIIAHHNGVIIAHHNGVIIDTDVLMVYTIEEDDRWGWRFRSLFNSCIGSWSKKRDKVIEEAESHKKLVLMLLNK